MSDETLSFEKSFERIESILEKINGGKIPLEESIRLFEEADQLIRNAASKLQTAEQKVEALIKGKGGEISLNAQGVPKTEPFVKT